MLNLIHSKMSANLNYVKILIFSYQIGKNPNSDYYTVSGKVCRRRPAHSLLCGGAEWHRPCGRQFGDIAEKTHSRTRFSHSVSPLDLRVGYTSSNG